MHFSNIHHCSHVIPCAPAGTQLSKFICEIYRTHGIIVFPYFVLLLLYISHKEKFFIEGFFIEHPHKI